MPYSGTWLLSDVTGCLQVCCVLPAFLRKYLSTSNLAALYTYVTSFV